MEPSLRSILTPYTSQPHTSAQESALVYVGTSEALTLSHARSGGPKMCKVRLILCCTCQKMQIRMMILYCPSGEQTPVACAGA